MFPMILASLLFGLTHPLGAFLLEDTDTLIFSFTFLFMLTIIQLPFVLSRWSEVKRLNFQGQFDLLLISGLIGTFLYWCEFSSLQVGLPITHVTFLLLTVSAWTLLWDFFRGRGSKVNLNKWMLALLGSALLIVPAERGQFSLGFLLPVVTSILTAAWIIYSKKCQEAGIHPVICAFFNDLFSLTGVFFFIVIKGRLGDITFPSQVSNIFLYSLCVGVIPNVLLFYGLRTVGVVSASAIIMVEPIVSGVLAVLLNDDRLGIHFVLGALCIVISNIPNDLFIYLRKSLFYHGRVYFPKG